MALDGYFGFRRAAARPADKDNLPLHGAYLPSEWSERTATAVAVSTAVAVVVLIALLMGSIGP